MRRPARSPLPFATLALAAAIIAVYGVELAGDGEALCERFGFVPARPTFVEALTSLFLHDPGSWLHIAGNVAVLVLVGTFVERAIGSLLFGAVFIVGSVSGAVLHVVVDPTSTVPLVGASGGLFAVLALAGVLFGPGMLGFVVVLVGANIVQAFGGPGDLSVSFGAHLGGFALGVVAAGLARMRDAGSRAGVRARGSRRPC
jgi:membrane associated rhomboid family serine protease